MSKKREQKAETHEEILASAARLLRGRGISGASVADVMKGAGLTVGGFYAHFPTKEALVAAALRRTSKEQQAKLQATRESLPPDERAYGMVARYLSRTHRDRGDEGCPMPAVVGEVTTSAPELGPVLAEHIDDVAQLIAGDATVNAPALTPRTLGVAMVALMYGGLALARAVRGSGLSDEILASCRALARLALRRDAAKE